MKLTTKEKYHLHQRAQFFVHHSDIDMEISLKDEVDEIFQKQLFKKIEIPISRCHMNIYSLVNYLCMGSFYLFIGTYPFYRTFTLDLKK